MNRKQNTSQTTEPAIAVDTVLAAVKSVFKKNKPFKRFSGTVIKYMVGYDKYWITVYPPEEHNQLCLGLHCCRVDTRDNDNVYHVKPENLIKWLIFVKTHLEWKRDLHKKQMEAETEEDYNSIELAKFMYSHF